MRTAARTVILLLLLAAAALAAGGCIRRPDNYPPTAFRQSREMRLYEFRNMEKLLVAPFLDQSSTQHLTPYAERFAGSFANQLVRFRRFRVLYPDEFERAAAAVRAHHKTGRELALAKRAAAAEAARPLPPAERERTLALLERRFPDPKPLPAEGSEEFLVLAAQEAGADGVVVVHVRDFSPYMPKRVSVRVRVYGTGNLVMSAPDVLSMTDDGIPLDVPFTLRDRFIWEYEQLFDAHNRVTRNAIKGYAYAHDRYAHPFGHQIFFSSSDKFLEYVADHLASVLAEDANEYKRLKPKFEALARTRQPLDPAGSAVPAYE